MKNNGNKNHSQEKLPFYLQLDVNLWDRIGLSKNARHLHFTLLKLADAKSGEVRIGVHWFTPAEIDRRAKMSHNTRIKAMRELLAAGLVHCSRDRVRRQTKDRVLGKLRNHVVWGKAHFYVSLSPRQDWLSSTNQLKKPSIHKVSSTNQKVNRRRNQHKHSGSSTDQNQKDTSSNASIDQSVGGARNGLSILNHEEPKDLRAAVPSALGVESEFENIKKTGGSLKSTTPENHSEPAAASVHPEIQNQRDELISEAVDSLRRDRQEYGKVIHRDDIYEVFRKDANSLGWDFKEIQSTVKRIWELAFPSPKRVEDYLTEQLTAYIEKCISNPPKFTSADFNPECYNPISFHETDKLLEVELFYRRWPFELCDAAMQERIYARVEAQFGESLTKPEDRYGYQIVKRPPTDYVPDNAWLCTRANLLAMDWTEYPRDPNHAALWDSPAGLQ